MDITESQEIIPVLPKKLDLNSEVRKDAGYIDNQIKLQHAYDYLCHIGEAKE